MSKSSSSPGYVYSSSSSHGKRKRSSSSSHSAADKSKYQCVVCLDEDFDSPEFDKCGPGRGMHGVCKACDVRLVQNALVRGVAPVCPTCRAELLVNIVTDTRARAGLAARTAQQENMVGYATRYNSMRHLEEYARGIDDPILRRRNLQLARGVLPNDADQLVRYRQLWKLQQDRIDEPSRAFYERGEQGAATVATVLSLQIPPGLTEAELNATPNRPWGDDSTPLYLRGYTRRPW